jgi:DNA primase
MRSYFDRSALPPARTFYQTEVGELRRPDRKGWAKPKAGCPFHASESKTSFHVNLENGGFYCFGCDARGGDVIEFVRKRYRLSFPDALKRLGIRDYRPVPRKQYPAPVLPLNQRLARMLAQAVEGGIESTPEHRKRIQARDCLHLLARQYHAAIDRHDWDAMATG